jgi:hypothetical protein
MFRHHRHHNHLANMELGHLLTRPGLIRLEVSLMVSPGFLCQSVCSCVVFSVICKGAFCLHVANNFLCIPVFCSKPGLYLVLVSLRVCFIMCPNVS